MMSSILGVLAVTLVVIVTWTKGSLVQIVGKTLICPNNIAVFHCSDERFLYLAVETSAVSWSSFLDAETTSVGSTINHTVNSSPLKLQVIYNNQSTIAATLTITKPANLNGSTITCNTYTKTLKVPTKSGVSPTTINISANDDTGMLDVYWNSEGKNYCVQTNTEYEEVNKYWIIVDNGSLSIPLMNDTINTTYEINISRHPDVNTSYFIIEPCLFNDAMIFERNYTLDLDDLWTISQICHDSNFKFNTTCDSRGTWTTDVGCPTRTVVTESITYLVTDTEFTQPPMTEQSTVHQEDNTQGSLNLTIIVILTSVLGSCFITLLIGTFLGCLCGRTYMKKKLLDMSAKQNPYKSEENEAKSTQIYEELKPVNEVTFMNFSQNVAYGQVKRI